MLELPERLPIKGHSMEIIGFYGMGGELEQLFLWCHTCDPKGIGLKSGSIYFHEPHEYTTPREGMLHLRKVAYKHAKSTPLND